MKISSSISIHKLISTILTIHNIEYEDSGVYTCEFGNALGVTNSSGTLFVHGEFNIIYHLSPVHLTTLWVLPVVAEQS